MYQLVIGSYGKEDQAAIQIVEFDSDKLTFKKLKEQTGVASPSFLTLAQDGSSLYAVSEVEEGAVISYDLEEEWQETNRQPTGKGPCYLHLAHDASYIITTNYGGGTISLHPLDAGGAVQPLADTYSLGGNQTDSHPHMCFPLGSSHDYFITDLAQDKLFLFHVDTDNYQLIKKKAFSLTAGSGPRHIVCNKQQKIFYIVNEYQSSVSVYQFHEQEEMLELKQEVQTIASQQTIENYGADIHLSPNGEYLYTSNRGRNTITSYRVLADGCLHYWGETSVIGKWPRNFTLSDDGKYLFIANEHSNYISVLQTGEDGELMKTKARFDIFAPTCVRNYYGKG